MSKTLTTLCTITSVVLTCLFIVMLFVVNGNAFTRYLLSFSVSWSEELTRYCMVWMVMLGAAVLSLFEDHIALHLPNNNWPKALRNMQRWFQHLVVLIVSAITAWTAWHFVIGMTGVQASGLRISMLYPTLAIPVGFTLITLAKLVVIFNDIAKITNLPAIPMPTQKSVMDNSFKISEEFEYEIAPILMNGTDK